MDDPTFAQASLTPRLGGLGLRKVIEHADFAYHASWHEAQKTAKEVWTAPPDLPEKYRSQKEASFEFDEKMHAYLIDQSDARGAQRLRRAAQPRACGLLLPSRSTKMAKILHYGLGSFKLRLLTVSESMWWIRKFLVLCVSRLLINLATTPLAAQRMEIQLFARTEFMTWLEILRTMECCGK